MNKCNAIIKTGPRKGLSCKYKAITGSNNCNLHNNNKKELLKNNISKLPNEIVIKIINYTDIINVIQFRLVNKYFLSICDYILDKYINIDVLFKILNIYDKRLKIAPLTIKNKKIIKKESQYIQNIPVYETYEIEYDTSFVNYKESFYVYRVLYDNKIKFYPKNSKNLVYVNSIIEVWNNQKLSELIL